MPEEIRIGDLRCRILSDGELQYQRDWVFRSADPTEVAEELSLPYTCLLIEGPRNKVLVDAGAGGFAPTTGRLPNSLAEAGVRPDEIDTVIVTHGHVDHIGGLRDADGGPAFPAARHVMASEEWRFWTSELIDLSPLDVPEELRSVLIETARRCLPSLQPSLELVDDEKEIAPGVTVIPAPGHTTGHLAVLIHSGKQQMLHLTDAVIHPLHLKHPGWGAPFDLLPDVAESTRERLLDRAAADEALVSATHFSPSRPGRLSRGVSGDWLWNPVT